MSARLLTRPPARRITVPAVAEVLRELAAEDPDRVDRRTGDGLPPRYIDRGRPNCLVAVVLTRLGFSPGVLKALDAEHGTGNVIAGVQVGESRHPALRKLDPYARRLLQYVQQQQDRGFRWGRIVNEAFARSHWPLRNDLERKPWISQLPPL